VAVVVPSPATSFVLVAASFRSCAPMFSNGSSSSISFATVTPSCVTFGAPNFLSRATCRPRGPRVVFTASANASMPSFSERRACSLNSSCFAGICFSFFLFGYDGEHVRLAHDQILFVFELELGAGILRVQHDLADLQLHVDAVAVVQHAAGTDGDHLALLGLLARRIGEDESALGYLVLLAGTENHAVAKRRKFRGGGSLCHGATLLSKLDSGNLSTPRARVLTTSLC